MKSRCSKNTALIACAVLEDEINHLLGSNSSSAVIRMMEQGLHNEPDKLRFRLQEAVNEIEQREEINTIALVYGLCSRGIEGVSAKRCKLIVPRCHDCITLLLGSRKKYAQYVSEHPGTYWYSPGWNRCHTPPGKERLEECRAGWAKQYDEDTVEYLLEFETAWMREYKRASYVDPGIGPVKDDVNYTKECADWLGWEFDLVKGNLSLLEALLTGNCDEDRFLILEPGTTARFTPDDRIMEAVPAT